MIKLSIAAMQWQLYFANLITLSYKAKVFNSENIQSTQVMN